jgi:hypothetical protein
MVDTNVRAWQAQLRGIGRRKPIGFQIAHRNRLAGRCHLEPAHMSDSESI